MKYLDDSGIKFLLGSIKNNVMQSTSSPNYIFEEDDLTKGAIAEGLYVSSQGAAYHTYNDRMNFFTENNSEALGYSTDSTVTIDKWDYDDVTAYKFLMNTKSYNFFKSRFDEAKSREMKNTSSGSFGQEARDLQDYAKITYNNSDYPKGAMVFSKNHITNVIKEDVYLTTNNLSLPLGCLYFKGDKLLFCIYNTHTITQLSLE